jgi:hypothetical protein
MAKITIPPGVASDLYPYWEGAHQRLDEGRPDKADSVYLKIEQQRSSKTCRVEITQEEARELWEQADYTIGPDSYVGEEPDYAPLKRDYKRLMQRIKRAFP